MSVPPVVSQISRAWRLSSAGFGMAGATRGAVRDGRGQWPTRSVRNIDSVAAREAESGSSHRYDEIEELWWWCWQAKYIWAGVSGRLLGHAKQSADAGGQLELAAPIGRRWQCTVLQLAVQVAHRWHLLRRSNIRMQRWLLRKG